MDKYMKKIIVPILVVLVIMSLFIAWFYWFQYRPTKIRFYCSNQGEENARKTRKSSPLLEAMIPEYKEEALREEAFIKNYEFFYKKCLHEQGLK